MTRDWKKFYHRIKSNKHNVKFIEFENFIKYLGYVYVRTNGSHKIYHHPDIPDDILNIQPFNSDAKPAQISSLIRIIEQFNLMKEV